MCAYKVKSGADEQERIDRQKAAFGAATLAKLKDLNVLIIGCRGVGVEAAKNLILSNVGAVVVATTGAPVGADGDDVGATLGAAAQTARRSSSTSAHAFRHDTTSVLSATVTFATCGPTGVSGAVHTM